MSELPSQFEVKLTGCPARGAVLLIINLWAAAAAADPSWDGMSGERESRGRLCEHIEIL